MDIGASILTRFADGDNKDLLCKYVASLRPIDIVTDLRSDPEDPAQWERGLMGKVHRPSWLQMRRRVLETLKTCTVENVQKERRFPILSAAWTMNELLLVSAQLNYTDLIDELISLGASDTFATLTWNMIYGPFRNMGTYKARDAEQVVMGLIHQGAYPPLRPLFDKYGKELSKSRDHIIRSSIGVASAGVLKYLVHRMGKPDGGQAFIEEAITGADVETMRFFITLLPIYDAQAIRSVTIKTKSLEKYQVIPDRIRNVAGDIQLAVSYGAVDIVRYLLPFVESYEWLNKALSNLFGRITQSDARDIVRLFVEDRRFDPSRDLDLKALKPYYPESRLFLIAFLSYRRVATQLSSTQFEQLYVHWMKVPKIAEYIQHVMRKVTHRPTLEGEPPLKMLKDPLAFYQ